MVQNKRFGKEILDDIKELEAMIDDPNTSPEEREEIRETLYEIYHPEELGDIIFCDGG